MNVPIPLKNSSLLILILCCSWQSYSQSPLPEVTYGKIERVLEFESEYITARIIEIWLPDGYPEVRQYGVLYMHDGQMLYDATKTWNKQAWEADETAQRLMQSEAIKPFIIVGIWNGGSTCHSDYFPQKPF